jgi:hypothetical protein
MGNRKGELCKLDEFYTLCAFVGAGVIVALFCAGCVTTIRTDWISGEVNQVSSQRMTPERNASSEIGGKERAASWMK